MKHRYTDQQLADAVASSTTWADTCRKIGVKPMTGSQTHLKNRAVKAGIDYSHFVGKSFTKGRPARNKVDIEEYLSNRQPIHSGKLRLKLIKEGIKEAICEVCGITEWLGQPAPLELDHINSDHFDNSLENLQILCPNCHALKTAAHKKK